MTLFAIGFFIFCGSLGALYQFFATKIEEYRYLPKGTLVDVGGYRLHVNYRENGSPTVVFDAGLGGISLGWERVESEVGKFASTVSYDRAGYGWSDESPLSRTSLNISEELHALLHHANIPGPYLLVGHSFGGANVLLFADRYPEETLGIVLVDSVHEDYFERIPFETEHSWLATLLGHSSTKLFLSFIGITRILGPSLEIKKMFAPLSIDVQDRYIAQISKFHYTKTMSRELSSLSESLSQLKNAQGNFANKPLIVVSAHQTIGKESNSFSNSIQINLAWNTLQKELLNKSRRSKQLIADHSDHMIPHHEPEIIVEAIKEIERISF